VNKLSRSTFQQSSLGGELERLKGELKSKKQSGTSGHKEVGLQNRELILKR
jgi:hypothetical protein